MDVRKLFEMNYITLIMQTVVLVFWVFFAFPTIVGFAGMAFNFADPVMAGLAFFTGLMISVMVFKIMKYREGY